MKLNIHSFGGKLLQKAIRKANKDLQKSYSELVKRIAKTAVAKARELAPKGKHSGEHYYQSIKQQTLTKFTQWMYAERKGVSSDGEKRQTTKGYLAGILEYGRKTYRPMAPRPHMEIAVKYAMEVHEKEIFEYFNGSFAGALRDFM